MTCDENVGSDLNDSKNPLEFFSKPDLYSEACDTIAFKLIHWLFDNREDIVEELKKSDVFEEAMLKMSKSFPKVFEVLLDERDRYMTAVLQVSAVENENVPVKYFNVKRLQTFINN